MHKVWPPMGGLTGTSAKPLPARLTTAAKATLQRHFCFLFNSDKRFTQHHRTLLSSFAHGLTRVKLLCFPFMTTRLTTISSGPGDRSVADHMIYITPTPYFSTALRYHVTAATRMYICSLYSWLMTDWLGSVTTTPLANRSCFVT